MRAATIVAVACTCALAVPAWAAGSGQARNCVELGEGIINYPAGHYLAGKPVPVGFDPYGYDFSSHLFFGSYANAYLGADGLPPYEGDDEPYLAAHPQAEKLWYWPLRRTELRMSWTEAWLSNRDCDGDQRLDRHRGFHSYLASGAELTNHIAGGEGEARWVHFSRMVAAPAGAKLRGGRWYGSDGTLLGPAIWGSFAVASSRATGVEALFVRPVGAAEGIW